MEKQLDELGVKDTDELSKRFESNGRYLVETFKYELKDNEIIRSMSDKYPSKAVEKKEKEDNIGLIIGIILIVGALIAMLMGYRIY